jgi:hypothetical protein
LHETALGIVGHLDLEALVGARLRDQLGSALAGLSGREAGILRDLTAYAT